MQIKNSTLFIGAVVLCFVSFHAGGFSRISGDGGELVEGIVLSGEDADRTLDSLNLARPSGDSAKAYGKLIADGIGKLRESNEKQRILIDAIRKEIDVAEENSRIISESFEGMSDAIGYGWQIILEDARALERIGRITGQIDENNGKDFRIPE